MQLKNKHPFLLVLAGFMPVVWLASSVVAQAAETSGQYVHPALDNPKVAAQVAEAPKEGSKSKSYSHGSPDGGSSHGSPHGKGEGSKSKSGHGSYSHGSGHHKPGHHAMSSGSHSKKHPAGYGKSSHGGHHSKAKGHGGKNPFKHVLCFAKKLGLTEDQLAKIKDGKFEYTKQHIKLAADHTIAHMELDRLAHSGKLDEAGMRAIGDELVRIKTAKIKAMVEAKITLLQILTDEQRQQMSQMHSKRKK